ncbi:MAG: hypothetical protein EOO91_01270 [Pedobacter sp.]|nr:MAG: hypothetical protein EOO91_01270 [Pedobacter sp.]
MRKLLISLVTLITLFTACKKNSFEIEKLPIEVGEIKNHILNVKQAEKIAILHSMYPDVLSKESTQNIYNIYGNPKQHPQKQIKSSFALKEGQTNPTLYILNYEEGGFAIVSGDDRMTPILAYSDKGSFEMTEIEKLPPGVKHWVSSNHRFIADIRSGKQKEDMASKSLWQDFKDKSELTKGNNAVLSSRPNCSIENEGESYAFNYTNGASSKHDLGSRYWI